MKDCPFCSPDPEQVIYESPLVLGLWDRYPVTPGHCLLVPRRHVATWWHAREDERTELMQATVSVKRIIDKLHVPDGYNLGMNAGEAAGQTVPHLHLHVIPRYRGDVPDPRGGVRYVIPEKANYLVAGPGSNSVTVLREDPLDGAPTTPPQAPRRRTRRRSLLPSEVEMMNELPVGRHLTLGDLCTCTETYHRFEDEIYPYPSSPQTLMAFEELAEDLLDPIIDHFGRDRFRLTYGFCSTDLRRHLKKHNPETGRPYGRIAPKLDQHMGHELGRHGAPVCTRPGAAADFQIEGLGSDELVDWILARELPFDSLYFYGSNRPIHLSHGPEHRRDIWTFTDRGAPTRRGIERWAAAAAALRPGD